MNFLENICNWNNHRPLLWLALEGTQGDVLEMGMGDGSTPYLNHYCKANNRELFSIDNNEAYYNKFKYMESESHKLSLINDWSKAKINKKWGVVLIDHAPGERRHIDAIALKDSDIIVVHDAEHEGLNYDVYHISKITEHFKYRLDLSIPQHPAKTIMLSNKIDVSRFNIPNFIIE